MIVMRNKKMQRDCGKKTKTIKYYEYLVHVSAGAQCYIELRNFSEAVKWCDEGLKVHPTEKKLQELRAAADKHKVLSLMGSVGLSALNGSSVAFFAPVCINMKLISVIIIFLREPQREMPGKPRPKKKSCMVRKRVFWQL